MATTTAADESAAPFRAAVYKLAAIGLFSSMGALIKALGPEFPTGQVVFARGLFAFISVFFMVRAAGGLSCLKTRHPLGHVMRSLSGLAAMTLGFAALTMIPLVDAIAIGFAAPLFTTLLAAWFLGEVVRIYRWSAVVVGFIGVLIILQPSGLRLLDPVALAEADERYAMGAAIALLGAFFVAMAMVAIRRMTGTESNAAIVFYFTLTTVVASGLTLPFAWRQPEGMDWAILVGIGLIGGVGQICLTLSYRYAQASMLAPFDYTAILVALVLGYVFFDEVPAPMVLVGAAVVIIAGLFIIWRERVRQVRRDAQPGGGLPGGLSG